MSESNRVLVIGWDAADWKVMRPLLKAGLMPGVAQLMREGVYGDMATLSPVLSPMLWTSIATGKRPFKHGVLGFTEPTPDGQSVRPVTNLSRKTKAVWNILNQHGKRCQVVGWWPSHPAEPIEGAMVSNHYHRSHGSLDEPWPLPKGAVHPPRLAETLAELRFHPQEVTGEHLELFLPNGHLIDQTKDRKVATCAKMIAECTSVHSAATWLLENEPWDFAGVYYDAIDHFSHAFMRYHPPKLDFVPQEEFDLYQNVVAAGYVYHDMMLCRLLELAGPEATVILLSDHGFHPDHLRRHTMPAEAAGPAAEHREYGIFLMRGPGVRQGELVHGANLLDVAPTVLACFGLPVGADMDGRPLVQVFESPPLIETIPSWDEVEGADGRHPEGAELDGDDTRQGLAQLAALGYIEPPSDDNQQAVASAVREQQYNLAKAYMDAGLHGEAANVLAELYTQNPLEFRFGIHLALCYQALEMTEPMADVVEDLKTRWLEASRVARLRLQEIRLVLRDRQAAAVGEAGAEQAAPTEVAGVEDEDVEEDAFEQAVEANGDGQNLISPAEGQVLRQLRAIAKGNERTLDYLSASVAFARGDFNGSLEHLERARESQTTVPGFHLQVGRTCLKLGSLAEAQQAFERALELDGDNAPAHAELAHTRLEQGRIDEALTLADAAIGLRRQFPAAHYYRGLALLYANDEANAAAAFRTALELNPRFAEVHDELANLSMGAEAARHAGLAKQIRRMEGAGRLAPEHPWRQAEPIDFEQHLPQWPEPLTPSEKRKPWLGSVKPSKATPTSDEAAGDPVIVVSGMPRSGTSLMMQMLAAGGVTAMTDDARPADDSNPRGYLEDDRVKTLHVENDWVEQAVGKALKVVAPLTPLLPAHCRYRVIYMERDFDEIVSSQRRMLERLERQGAKLSNEQLRMVLQRQADGARQLLDAHRVPTLAINYREAVEQPQRAAQQVADFLQADLDIAAMTAAADPKLYRERQDAEAISG